MKVSIPQKSIPKQINKGDIFGDIWASWNLDLESNVGKIRVSPKLVPLGSSTSLATMVKPIAFVRNLSDTLAVDSYFAVCNQRIIKTPLATITWVADTNTSGTSPTTTLSSLYSDGVDFNGSLIVSTLTDLAKLTSGTWDSSWWDTTLAQDALTTGIPHPLCVGFTKELLIGNGNNVCSITLNTSTGLVSPTVNSTRLILSSEYEVNWIRSSNSAYWIGCRHKFGGEGKVFMWDGGSDYVNGDYKIGHSITFAGVIKDEICYTVNGNGILLAFSGGGFTEVARFPIANNKSDVLDDALTTYPINIHRNGMSVVENSIHILLNATIESTASTSTLLENMLSGIWVYTSDNGLYHKYGISKGESNVLEFGSPLIVQAGAIFPTGDKRKFLVGAQLYVADSGTELGEIIGVNYDNSKKMGYLITPKIYTNDIEEMWKKVYLLYSNLKQTGDFIQLKYRTSVENIPSAYQINQTGSLVGTWTTTTTFTTTLSYFSGVSVGDEIEILSGEGAGLSANITDISETGGTYTVTIDYTLTGASGNFMFRTSNWIKIDSITDLVTKNKEFGVGTNANWIQFKIIMYGLGSQTLETSNSPELEKLISISDTHLKGG